jgi:predicted kinase
VVLAIGLPGSGKSSWFKRHDIRPLSSDLLRELLFDDAQEQRFQDLVFEFAIDVEGAACGAASCELCGCDQSHTS